MQRRCHPVLAALSESDVIRMRLSKPSWKRIRHYSKKKTLLIKLLIRYFLVLIVVSFFLPPFVALPYMPNSTFYFPFWIVLVFFSYPRALLNTGFMASFAFLLLHFLYTVMGWYQNDVYSLMDYFFPLAFSFSVLEYFKESKDFKRLDQMLELSLILLIITSITSIISLTAFPSAARDMAGFLSASDQRDLADFYMLIGIGNYYFFHNIALCVPLLVFLIQNKNSRNLVRLKWLAILGITFLAVMRGGFSSAFGIFFIGLALSVLISRLKSVKAYLGLLIGLGIVYFLFSPILAPVLYSFADILDSEFISPRLRNVAANLDGSAAFLSERDSIYTSSYKKQLEISLEGLLKNPFTGSGVQGGHHFWADALAKFGLIGFLPWIFIIIYLIRSRSKWFFGRYKIIVIHVFITLFFIGFFKPIGLDQMFTFISIFIPAFLLLLQRRELDHQLTSSYKSRVPVSNIRIAVTEQNIAPQG